MNLGGKRLKEAIKKVGITLGLLVAAAIVGYLLLVISFKINIPEEKYKESMGILAEEGYHQRDSLRNGKSDYYHEIYPDILDIGTDEHIVRYSTENPASAFRQALVADWAEAWARYWHGYVVFLRPMFKLLDLSEVRMLNAGLQLFLFAFLALLTYKVTTKKRYALALCSVYFLLIPSATGINFQYSSIYYSAVISAIVLLIWKDWFVKNNRYIYLFAMTGAFTAFVDFLTYPLLAWAVPAALLLICVPYSDKADTGLRKCLESVLHLIKSAVAWILGYLFFWMEKWVLATAFSEVNVIKSALDEIHFRTGTAESFSFIKRLDISALNFSHLTAKPFVFLFAVWVVFWIVSYIIKGFEDNRRITAFYLMLFSGPAWFFMAANHTGGHHLFTWKNALATVLAMFMIICISTEYTHDKAVAKLKEGILKRVAVTAVCLMLSVVTYVLLPIEEETVNNYSASGADATVTFSEGEKNAYEMSFVPRHSRIKNVSILMSSADTDNAAVLSVSQKGKEKYSLELKAGTEPVTGADVHWHLKAGEEYLLTISTENMDAPITLWTDGGKSLPENEKSDMPIVISYTYHAPFTDKAATLFYFIEWFCLYMTVAEVIRMLIADTGKTEQAVSDNE